MEKKWDIRPEDEHNLELLANTHPGDWTNPEPEPRYNLVVIGGGTAGLVSAAGAAGMGAKVALVERALLGGDCLNYGCIPSKALIRSSRVAADIRNAGRFGIHVPTEAVEVDFPAVMERMRRIRASISHHDSAKRFEEMGIDVFLGEGLFTGRDSVEVAGKTLAFKKAVIATGARPFRPVIEGLEESGFLTNETVFNLTEKPGRMAILGGGPIGSELAQAFARLGVEVFLIHKNAHILDREDEDAADIVQEVFRREGIHLVLGAKVSRVERRGSEKVLHVEGGNGRETIVVDEILAGAGRVPNVEGLGLEAAGVEFDTRRGVIADNRFRTTNQRIYAAGDVCMPTKFTHAADAAARAVIQNALFIGGKKESALRIPWATYTDPEIAHVGMYEKDASAEGIEVETFIRSFDEVDRAVADGEEEGFVKVHVRKGTDRIVGATIVARSAGDMISEITLAMAADMGLKKLSSVIHPYPTQAEAVKQVGDAFNRTRLTPSLKRWFTRYFAWTR